MPRLPADVDGVVAFPHGEGCGHAIGPDIEQLRRTLGGSLVHPNVSAALILGLGCEVNQIDCYLGPEGPRGRVTGLTLQASGGTRATVEAGRAEAAIASSNARPKSGAFRSARFEARAWG